MEKELIEKGSFDEKKIKENEQLIGHYKDKIKKLEDEINKFCEEESNKLYANYVGNCYQFGDIYRKILAIKVINAEKICISYQTILHASTANYEIESYISSILIEKDKKIEDRFGKQINNEIFMKVIDDYCKNLTNRLNLDKEDLQKRFYLTCQ